MRTRLTDRHNLTLAFVDEDAAGRRTLYARDGRTLGRYDPRADETRDHRGLLVGRGDLLARLVTADA